MSDQQQEDLSSQTRVLQTSARHPHLQPHLQPARGNSLFEEMQWAPALKEALPTTSAPSHESITSRQSSLDALNNYNQAALNSGGLNAPPPYLTPSRAASIEQSQGAFQFPQLPPMPGQQHQVSMPPPEPLNAANLASAAFQPAQSQLFSQWGFVNNPTFADATKQQPWFSAAAHPDEPIMRAYTPSYTSRSSFDGSAIPSSPMPMRSNHQRTDSQQNTWRETGYDDGLSFYSASSVSRPTTPSNYPSFYNSPSLLPTDDQHSPLPSIEDVSLSVASASHDHHTPDDASSRLAPGGGHLSQTDRHATIQPASGPQHYPNTPSRDTTMTGNEHRPPPHSSAPPSFNFLGQDFSTSPSGSPKSNAALDLPYNNDNGRGVNTGSHSPASSDPQQQQSSQQSRVAVMSSQPNKTNSLSKLDIPMAPSIEFEAATATAGPATARPNGQTSTQLDRMIAQSRGQENAHYQADNTGRFLHQMPDTMYHPEPADAQYPDHSHLQAYPQAQSLLEPHQHGGQQQWVPRRSRSHSETDATHLALQMPQLHQQPHPGPWDAQYGSSIAPNDVNSRSNSPYAQQAYQQQAYQAGSASSSSRQGSQDSGFPSFDQMRPSLIGPRRSSNASDVGRPTGPYDDHMSTFRMPGTAPRTMPASNSFVGRGGHHRMAQSEDFGHSVPFFTSAPAFQPPPSADHHAFPSSTFQPLPSTSLFADGSSGGGDSSTGGLYLPSFGGGAPGTHSRPSSNCPSPSLSASSGSLQPYYDASPHLFPSSRDGSVPPMDPDFNGEPVHLTSQTTVATKEAAARRRKPGTEAKYSCHYCGETFTRNYNLRGHMRAHNGAKPFKCTEPGCHKAFARSHDLRRHADLHTTISKYKCHSCSRAFKRLDALQRHHRSEAGQSCAKALLDMGITDPKLNGMMRTSVRL